MPIGDLNDGTLQLALGFGARAPAAAEPALPEPVSVDLLGVYALFNGQREFCSAMHDYDDVPPGCFAVRVTVYELAALRDRRAIVDQVHGGRWQVRIIS